MLLNVAKYQGYGFYLIWFINYETIEINLCGAVSFPDLSDKRNTEEIL